MISTFEEVEIIFHKLKLFCKGWKENIFLRKTFSAPRTLKNPKNIFRENIFPQTNGALVPIHNFGEKNGPNDTVPFSTAQIVNSTQVNDF